MCMHTYALSRGCKRCNDWDDGNCCTCLLVAYSRLCIIFQAASIGKSQLCCPESNGPVLSFASNSLDEPNRAPSRA